MKTIRINTKQILLGIFFSLFILAGTVNAKGTETGFVSSYENTVEAELQVEEWMVNEIYWNYSENAIFFETELENNLEMENWMTEDTYWMPQSLAIVESTTDEELTIENWMITENYWN
jgi:hypothetical protein